MPNLEPREPGACGCGAIVRERNRYYTGKFMTARDFQGEQDYFLSRHRLHNRLFHGWGIVCGLGVSPHPDPKCADRWVVVRSGIALDCCGRELILAKDIALELPLPPPMDPEEECGEEPELPAPFLICLRYVEEEIEMVPAVYGEDCNPEALEANRIRENVALDTMPLEDVEADCWPRKDGDDDICCRDDCGDELPGPGGMCLEPQCPCGHCVPLALVLPYWKDKWVASYELDDRGRRQLPLPAEYLTHIAAINWQHGAEISLSQLRKGMDGQLSIHFDRKLLPANGDCNGINRFTFTVQYEGAQADRESLPWVENCPPYLDESGCTAIFAIDPEYLKDGGRYCLTGYTIFITLKCDFVADCHRNAVDGNHLGGQLPSGNGTPGGLFESWFRVKA